MASHRFYRVVLLAAGRTNGKVLNAVEPYIRRRVVKLYGGKSEAPRICPGEANCDRWKGASAKTHKGKEKQACKPCPMFDTKTDSARKSHHSLDNLASRSIDIRYERLAGYPRKEHLMTNFEFAGLYIAEQMFEREEIVMKDQTFSVLCALAGIKRD